MSGYTATYNRAHAGKAWAIAGYTLDGGGLCTACADSRFNAEACAHCFNPRFSCACADSPAPIFEGEASDYRDNGDHRGGCGLSCDTCGGVIVAACDPCRDSIEGV